ncbi:MAG: Ig-like domain-containing protein [Minwuia sp.]|nr:Ig-like domain-containing protein [Minwuia sp.]
MSGFCWKRFNRFVSCGQHDDGLTGNTHADAFFTGHGAIFRFKALDQIVQDLEDLDIEIVGGGGNAAPLAVDDIANTARDSSVSINLLASDSAADGDTLTAGAATATNGTNDTIVIEAGSANTLSDGISVAPDSIAFRRLHDNDYLHQVVGSRVGSGQLMRPVVGRS